ncbi:ABC transporter ATP-binding protein [Alicyclobacillus contaminans]|uniref:ABC transporter ATP-binding protein n=1 Tax=Alicyclobacillus contaminans TaxID=392016 RepID=UPI000416F5E7|nr:ABC transporter ATP-binding protein [Alicyclobacillus contaminans]GMA52222.1 ABC transporter ATP-binding protein [Alicyclobacillus contaminans]
METLVDALPPAPDPVLTVENLTVVRGGKKVVQGIDFQLKRGEVFGLIGPNGAGKSSTIGGLLGLHPLDDGAIIVDGQRFGRGRTLPVSLRRRIAYIPEQPMYYPDLTLREHLEWKQRLWNMVERSEWDQRIQELVDDFQLLPHMDKLPHECSKGTLQKLMIVSALFVPFDILIVDEPFVGLDVISIRKLRERMERVRAEGAALLVSTHVLDSAERMCHRFGFMMNGRLFAQGTLADLRSMAGNVGTSLEDIFIHMFEAIGGYSVGHEDA